MSDTFKQFAEIHKASLRGADLSCIPEKYINSKKLYDRFVPVMEAVRGYDLNKGVDFGCGVGAATVLGRLMGVEITGIDIPEYTTGPNPYSVVHQNLVKAGYPIKIFDTSQYPWDFAPNSFQFLLGFCAIGKDTSPNNVKDKDNMQQSDWVNDRLSELVRITRRKGIWFLGPKATIAFVRGNKVFAKSPKTIILKEWPL